MGKGAWDCFKSQKEFLRFTEQWIDAFLPRMKATGSFYIFNNPLNSAYILPMLVEQGAVFKNWITWHKKDGINASKRKYVNNQETILFCTMSQSYHFDADLIREPYLSKERIKHAAKKGILKNGKRWFPHPKGKLCVDVWDFSSHRHKVKSNGKLTKSSHPTPKPEDMIKRMVLASSREGDLVLDLFSGTGTTALVCNKLGRNFMGCENDPSFHGYLQKRLNNARRELQSDKFNTRKDNLKRASVRQAG